MAFNKIELSEKYILVLWNEVHFENLNCLSGKDISSTCILDFYLGRKHHKTIQERFSWNTPLCALYNP